MSGAVGFAVCGALVGLGVTMLLVYWVVPARVDAARAVAALAPTRRSQSSTPGLAGPAGRVERLGLWGMRTLPAGLWARTPVRELALLRTSLARFYGEKLLFAACGLLTPPLLATLLMRAGVQPPLWLAPLGALGLGAVMFFVPNYNALTEAKKARTEARRELAAYVDAVALERSSGSGVRQAMEHAAGAGDHWLWARIGEELARSRWSGIPPWDALADLGSELTLPELGEIADVLRLAGEEGTSAWSSLRARATAIRTTLLTDDLAAANADNERLSVPVALLGFTFIAGLMAPLLLRILAPT